MDTPICDFVRNYAAAENIRLHMPGHKGVSYIGSEQLDITEICGADSLYECEGIIAQSEKNASVLFGCNTYYSTEGSSQCIRAMLYLVMIYAKQNNRKPLIAAARNVHKTFLSAAALLDLDVDWLYSRDSTNYLSCILTEEDLEEYLQKAQEKPAALYVTSPDYLGNMTEINKLAKICHQHDVLLVVDNAHGAYLRFLPKSLHPIDQGADICCDSAHKTLPVLTGGAYLHLSDQMQAALGDMVKKAMVLFGSTSPSYLILQSLDAVNSVLTNFTDRLALSTERVKRLKEHLVGLGHVFYGQEPMKLTYDAKRMGYTGNQLAGILREHDIEPEFSDSDYLVLMITPDISKEQWSRLETCLSHIESLTEIQDKPPLLCRGQRVMSVRDAIMSPSEVLPVEQCLGRILAIPTVGCPPAVPLLVCGEMIDEHAIECFRYYQINSCSVVK